MDISPSPETISQLLGCHASYLSTVQVSEKIQDVEIWAGEVHEFQLSDHPQADACYAWETPSDRNDVKIQIALKIAPIASPIEAVKAVLANRLRGH